MLPDPKGHTYRYPRPSVSADAVVLETPGAGEGTETRVLLVRRRNEPFRDHWALPGGFLDMEETTEACARRELAEETGLSLPELPFRFVGLYDDPARDPRGRVLSAAYLVEVPAGRCVLHAGDDAADARFFPLSALPPLAFDHARILKDALAVGRP